LPVPPNPFPPEPPPEPLPPGTYPIIGPRLATYGVVQPIGRQLGLTQLGTLHERIGDTLTPAFPEGEGWGRSAWGRFFGQQIDNRYQAFADPRASGQLLGMQAGLDLWPGSVIPGHRDVVGAYFSYGNGSVDVDGLVTNLDATAYDLRHTGTLNLNAFSGGAYWTHYGPGGWYLDAILQGTGYEGTATAQFANLGLSTKLPTNGSGFLASLEGGYPIPLALGPNFILEPQAQIIWQHVSFDAADDGVGNIALGSSSGTTGRLGARAQWTVVGANGEVWQPYGRANLWRDWGGAAQTSFAGGAVGVPLVAHATRVEFAGGVTLKIDPSLSFYAQAGYQFATDNNIRRDGVKGDLGLRFTW
jgi:outer membrane autotransporter protein